MKYRLVDLEKLDVNNFTTENRILAEINVDNTLSDNEMINILTKESVFKRITDDYELNIVKQDDYFFYAIVKLSDVYFRCSHYNFITANNVTVGNNRKRKSFKFNGTYLSYWFSKTHGNMGQTFFINNIRAPIWS